MSDDLVRITVSGGKYTFVQKTDGSCYALRYGEPWREDIFDGMTLAMAHRIEELEAKLAKAVEALVRIADTPSEMTWGVDSEVREAMNGMEIIAETTLAELTGGKDE